VTEPTPDGGAAPTGQAAEVTRLLHDWQEGSRAAGDRLIQLVYDELHVIAEARMRREDPAHTLQATALVHEAYLRLADAGLDWSDRKHFFVVVARTMRRILTDHARARGRQKRGGAMDRVTLSGLVIGDDEPDTLEFVALGEAIDALAEQDARKATVVELHYFAGLSYDEVAEALDISSATVHRDLRMARAWLRTRMD
jgi:RNA polymerase sigma-70 factor, ECF subfamily